MKYIFKTSATMKDYNRDKWWVDPGIIREKIITADSTADEILRRTALYENRY